MSNERGLTLLPAAPGTCAHCATKHEKDDPHNFQSLFYGMRFKMQWGRDFTHADCVAHLSDKIKSAYRDVLSDFGIAWTEHPQPISEPYQVSTP